MHHNVDHNADSDGKGRAGVRGQAHREKGARELDGCQIGQLNPGLGLIYSKETFFGSQRQRESADAAM